MASCDVSLTGGGGVASVVAAAAAVTTGGAVVVAELEDDGVGAVAAVSDVDAAEAQRELFERVFADTSSRKTFRRTGHKQTFAASDEPSLCACSDCNSWKNFLGTGGSCSSGPSGGPRRCVVGGLVCRRTSYRSFGSRSGERRGGWRGCDGSGGS